MEEIIEIITKIVTGKHIGMTITGRTGNMDVTHQRNNVDICVLETRRENNRKKKNAQRWKELLPEVRELWIFNYENHPHRGLYRRLPDMNQSSSH